MSVRILAATLYLTLIVATNISFSQIGPVPATFVLVGLTLAARDFVHETSGRWVSLGLVVVGAGASGLLASPDVALASLVAFLLAETLDLLIYERVKARYGLAAGVGASGVVGSIIDSTVFLLIAFGSLAYFWAQVTGKLLATVAVAALALAVSAVRRRVTA